MYIHTYSSRQQVNLFVTYLHRQKAVIQELTSWRGESRQIGAGINHMERAFVNLVKMYYCKLAGKERSYSYIHILQ